MTNTRNPDDKTRNTLGQVLNITVASSARNSAVVRDGVLFVGGDTISGMLGDMGISSHTDWWRRARLTSDNVASVVFRLSSTFAVTTNGELYAAGANELGELGLGADSSDTVGDFTRVDVPPVAKVSAGYLAMNPELLLLLDGSVMEHYPTITSVPRVFTYTRRRFTDAVDVATNNHHMFVVERDGSLWSFDIDDKKMVWRAVASDVARVWASGDSYYYQTFDGAVWGAGGNSRGQSGIGTFSRHLEPLMRLPHFDNAVDLCVGSDFTFKLDADGVLGGCGENRFEGLSPDGARPLVSTLARIPNLPKVECIASAYDGAIALCADGGLWRYSDRMPFSRIEGWPLD